MLENEKWGLKQMLYYTTRHCMQVGRPCMITETNFNVHKTTGQVELNFS